MNGFSLGVTTFIIWITAKGRLNKYLELLNTSTKIENQDVSISESALKDQEYNLELRPLPKIEIPIPPLLKALPIWPKGE